METAAAKPRFRLTRPVVLVGLMGAGKTSIGKRLAQFLEVDFWDSDDAIETAAAMQIPELFARYGEASFREGEKRVIQRLLTQGPGVLSTGGGAFLDPDVRQSIAEAGISVWLRAELETLWKRVKDRSTRPLLQKPEPRKVLGGLLLERYPIYALADVVVDSPDGIVPDEMVQRVLCALRADDALKDQPTLVEMPS